MTSWTNDYIARCQIPAPGTLNLDHVTYFVPDHAAADRALERLGFTTTPLSSHVRRAATDDAAQEAGGGNHCVMLRRGYLAFLTPSGDTPLAASLHRSIKNYTGAHSILLGTTDPESDRARLEAAGFSPPPVARMERPVETPEGLRPGRIARLSAERGAHGGLQFVRHQTPELLWQQRWLDHPNRAFGLAAALYCVADPAAAAAHYSRLTGLAASGGASPQVATARGDIVFISPDTARHVLGIEPPAEPWIAGAVIDCGDTTIARSWFDRNGTPTREHGRGRFSIAAPPEVGGVLAFGPIGRAQPDFPT